MKMLIALDDSPCSLGVVGYATRFAAVPGLQVGLVHVLPNLPAMFWDEGHILSDEEKKERKKVVDKWIADRTTKMAPVFKEAQGILAKAGIKAEQVSSKSISDSTDISDSIVEEAKDNGYDTLLVGRCSRPSGLLPGYVADRIVSRAKGMAVIVVG